MEFAEQGSRRDADSTLTMQLQATIEETELRSLLYGMIPLRVDLSQRGDNETAPAGGLRFIDVTKIHRFELIPGRGMLLSARVELHWPARRLLRRVRIERIGLMLLPRIETAPGGETAIAADLRCTSFELRWVPRFITRWICRWLNRRLQQRTTVVRWDLSETLHMDFPQVSTRTNLESVGVDAQIRLIIGAEGLRVESPVQLTVEREEPKPEQPKGDMPNPALAREAETSEPAETRREQPREQQVHEHEAQRVDWQQRGEPPMPPQQFEPPRFEPPPRFEHAPRFEPPPRPE